MKELSLHILDIMQNSIRAKATEIMVTIREDLKENEFTIMIEDNGIGIAPELLEKVTNPFATTRKLRKVGLGIPLLEQTCKECAGRFEVESQIDKGTKVTAVMQHEHIDRLPLGEIEKTITALIMAKPDIHYIYKHFYNDLVFTFDTNDIKNTLGGVPINNLEILQWLEQYIKEGIKALKS